MSTLKSELKTLTTVLDELKVLSSTIYTVKNNAALTDHIILVTVSNSIHCNAVVDTLSKCFKSEFKENEAFFLPPKSSGSSESGWIILDANSIVIHVLLDELNDYYQLDKLFESMT